MTDLATTIPAGIDTALPAQVAPVLGTTPAGLAQMRYKGNGPKLAAAKSPPTGKVEVRVPLAPLTSTA